jgi:hypothetical protein
MALADEAAMPTHVDEPDARAEEVYQNHSVDRDLISVKHAEIKIQ